MDIMNWRKSSYSGGNGAECIETASTPDAVLVRDSKDNEGPVLAFGREAWLAFADQVRRSLAADPTLGPAGAFRGALVSGSAPASCPGGLDTTRSVCWELFLGSWVPGFLVRRPVLPKGGREAAHGRCCAMPRRR